MPIGDKTVLLAASGEHIMSPTGVYVMFMIAVVIDWMSVGPNSVRDRVAFVIALACFREGFNGSDLDKFVVQALGGVIDQTKVWSGDAYIADAETSIVIGAVVGVVGIYTAGCLMPSMLATKMGRFATMAFRSRTRLNWQLWLCAFFIGMTADLAEGVVGLILNFFVDLCVTVTGIMPGWIFGA